MRQKTEKTTTSTNVGRQKFDLYKKYPTDRSETVQNTELLCEGFAYILKLYSYFDWLIEFEIYVYVEYVLQSTRVSQT